MAQIRLDLTTFAHRLNVLRPLLDTLMDPSNLTLSKPLKSMRSMFFSMHLSWTKSLAHLEHVMGHC